MELFEQASGARMHTALYRPGGAEAVSLTQHLLSDLARFLTKAARAIAGAFLGLLSNRGLKSRLSYVGQLSRQRLLSYGVSGITARSAGLFTDLRLSDGRGYGVYQNLSMRSFLGYRGDNLDRFLLRIKEAAESLKCLAQLLALLGSGRVGQHSDNRSFLTPMPGLASVCTDIVGERQQSASCRSLLS